MSDGGSERLAAATAPGARGKPPWWLITSWIRWGWFGFLSPGLLGWFAVERITDGRGRTTDGVLLACMAFCIGFGLVQFVLTLRAYRRDPGLRTRDWPTPTGLPRQVTFLLTTLAIIAVGVLLLVSVGWGPAVFVVVVVGGSALTIRHFGSPDDADPAGQQAQEYARPHVDEATPDR